MATSTFRKNISSIKELDKGNIQSYNVYQDTILNYVKSSNCPMGATFVYTQNATDSYAPGSVSVTLVIKPAGDGSYARIYHFVSKAIYFTGWQSNIPSSITWEKLC